MKKLFMGFGILVLTIFMLVGASFAYTYDGDIDPAEFRGWTPTTEPMEYEPGVMMIELSNTTDVHPDADLGIVYLVQMQGGTTILAYQYHSKSTGKVRYFEINPVTGHYEEVSGFDNGTFRDRWEKKLQ
jgi:hypothetical protein